MTVTILEGDCREVLRSLPDESAHCVVTSPPYWNLRDYGVDGQIGLEADVHAYVGELVAVFREARRVLRADGTLWLNLGDSYASDGGPGWQGKNGQRADRRFTLVRDTVPMRDASRVPGGLKPKDLVGMPWRVALALQADGWWLRQDIVWSKPHPMPENVADRCTKAHEYVFLMSRSERYHFDAEAISEPASSADRANGSGNAARQAPHERGSPDGARGRQASHVPWKGERRNKRSVWEVATAAFGEAHFATFPPALVEPCILAGCPKGGTVLDPFGGAGTTGLVADRLGRDAVLIELNAGYADMARRRIRGDAPLFAEVT